MYHIQRMSYAKHRKLNTANFIRIVFQNQILISINMNMFLLANKMKKKDN